MAHQPKMTPLASSDFFADGASARPLLPGTLPRGALLKDNPLASGHRGDSFAEELPLELTLSLLKRGQERFEIYCAVCHGLAGEGDGMAVQRGFSAPPSFFEKRLLTAPDGYYFNVMTQGMGLMSSYAERVSPRDRWAIVAYLRALQLSRSLKVGELNREERAQLPLPEQGGMP